MGKIVIVVGDRKSPRAHHIKFEGTVRVGRALSSDVILSDEHVEPLQLVMFEQDGAHKVQVMPGINPVFRNGEVVEAGLYDFVSGDEWHMGRTSLQAFHESHASEPTVKQAMKEYRGSRLAQILIFFAVLIALLGGMLFVSWIGDYDPIEWDKKLAGTLADASVVLVLIWAILWSLIGRMVTGRNQFLVHFCAASLFVFVDVLNGVATEYLSYGTNHDALWDFIYYLIMAMIVAMLLYAALAYALNLRHTQLIALAIGILFSVFFYVEWIMEGNELEPVFNDLVKPPFAILVKPQTMEQFGMVMEEAFVDVNEMAQ